MDYQPDMDLLRRFEEVREACQEAAADRIRTTLQSTVEELDEEPDALADRLRRLSEAASEASDDRLGTGPTPEAIEAALDGAERFMFADDPDAGESLAASFRPALRSLKGDEPRGAGHSPDESPAPGDGTKVGDSGAPSLDDISSLLIQMEAPGPDELEKLRSMTARLVEDEDTPPAVRTLLQEALEELETAPGSDSGEDDLAGFSRHLERAMSSADPHLDQEEREADGEDGPSPQGEYADGLPSDSDQELLEAFLEESREHLERAEEAVLRLEEAPDDPEAVNVLFRAFHTIKGSSGFMGLDRISDLSHRAETVFDRVREGELSFTPAAADLALRTVDVLEGLLGGVGRALEGGDRDVPSDFLPLLELLEESDLDRRIEEDALTLPEPDSSASESGGAGGDDAVDDSVRVSTERLDRLVDLVGELVVSHSMIAEDSAAGRVDSELSEKVKRSEKILRELQDLSTSMRMVPLRRAFRKISRVVRDVSRKAGKPVELVTEGEDTELDRNMVDVIADPLIHMARNSIDHGIEPPEERRAAEKPEQGTVRLSARREGGNVVIEIADDGRGLDRDAIAEKAIERGIIDSAEGMADEDVYQLIFEPGFSTVDEVTDVSGRGVGMDVVKRSVESLRGRIDIESEPGEGSVFSIHLPLTLALTDGMLIRVGRERFIVPTLSIQVTVRPTADDISTVAGEGEMARIRGELMPMVRLHQLYRVEDGETDPTEALLMVVGEGSRKTAFLVDELLGQEQFVVKALSGQVGDTPGVAGGAILGDGEVGLILDTSELIDLGREAGTGVPAHARSPAAAAG